MTTNTYEPKCGLHKGDDIQFAKVETCEVCGHRGSDVHEYPTYSNVLGRDTTEYQCDDIDACLNRKYAGTYMERANA
ncbi:MAG: hypothetical protein PHE15_00015 [Dehalococcoidales bacterium]|nr:hypothetical protein [Dehalococcoidales bacterium]